MLHFCRPGFLTIHIPPWSSMDLQVLRICRSQRLDMGLKRVSWVQRYQGQCRALRPLGHQGYRLRNYKKDPPLCSGYSMIIPCDMAVTSAPQTMPPQHLWNPRAKSAHLKMALWMRVSPWGKGNAALNVPDTRGRNSRAAQVDEPGPSRRTRSGLSQRSAHPYAHQEHDY